MIRIFLSRVLILALCLLPAPSHAYWQSVAQQTSNDDQTNTDNACIASSGTTTTFTATKLGAGAPGRIIVVSINWSDSTLASTAELTGVTVDGIDMTRAVRAAGDDQNSNSEIWYATVTSGATGDVVVTSSTAVDGMTIGVYRLVNFNVPVPFTTATGTTSAAATGLAAPMVAFAAASRRVNVATSLSSMANNFSSACGTFLWGVHASQPGTVGTLTTNISPTSDTPLIAMAAWQPSISYFGALVRKTANQTTADYSSATQVVWGGGNAVVYDTSGFYSSSNNTRLTVPAAFNNYYGQVCAQIATDATLANTLLSLEIQRSTGGGAVTSDYDGHGGQLRSNGNPGAIADDSGWIQSCTQPILFATDDYFVATLLEAGDNSITITAASSSFSIRIFGTSVTGVLAKKASNQTANFNFVNIAWDGTDIYDSDGYHDPSSSNTNITIPSSANGKTGIARSNVLLTSVTAGSTIALNVTCNGGTGQTVVQNATATTAMIEAQTPAISLATGDVCVSTLFSSDTSTTIVATQSTFGIYIVDQSLTLSGALARKAVDQTTANYSTPADVAWPGTDIYDTASFHDAAGAGAVPNQIVIPASVNGKFGIFFAQVITSGATVTVNSTASLSVNKAGSSAYNGFGGQSKHNGSFTDIWSQVWSQPVILSTGDIWTANFYTGDTSITVESDSSRFGILILNFNLDPANDNTPMFLNKVA